MAAKTFNHRMRSFRILLCLLCTAVHCTFAVHDGISFIPVFLHIAYLITLSLESKLLFWKKNGEISWIVCKNLYKPGTNQMWDPFVYSHLDHTRNDLREEDHVSHKYLLEIQRKIPIEQNIVINYFIYQFYFRLASCVKFNHQGIDSTLPYRLASSICCHNICYYWCWVVYGTASHDMLWQHNR